MTFGKALTVEKSGPSPFPYGKSSLHYTPCGRKCRDPRHSDAVAATLVHVMRIVNSAPSPSVGALRARPFLDFYIYRDSLSNMMCDRQQMLITYLLGLTLLEQGQYFIARTRFFDAILHATALGDRGALTELLWRYGATALIDGHVSLSLSYLQHALETLTEIENDCHCSAPVLQYDLFISLAQLHWTQGGYDSSQRMLAKASELVGWFVKPVLRTATIDWMEALNYRAMGALLPAYEIAARTSEVWLTFGSENNAGRMQIITADIMLDACEAGLSGHLRANTDELLARARRTALLGLKFLHQSLDVPGASMALLTLARQSGLTRRDEGRLGDIIEIIRLAQMRRDEPLFLQGRTALAQELEFRGEFATARKIYFETSTQAATHDMHALGIRAAEGAHRLSQEAR